MVPRSNCNFPRSEDEGKRSLTIIAIVGYLVGAKIDFPTFFMVANIREEGEINEEA